MDFATVSPAAGERLRELEGATPSEVRGAVRDAHEAFLGWRRTPLETRAGRLREAARILRGDAAEYAVLVAREKGKPVRSGRSEAEKCAWVCEHYADHGPELLAVREVAGEASRILEVYRPLGVVLAIMPWNFPF